MIYLVAVGITTFHPASDHYFGGNSLHAQGTRLWGTYYGGASLDYGHSTAVDASGNVYLAGVTNNPSGIASGGFNNTYAGGSGGGDAFLVKLFYHEKLDLC